MADNVSVTQGSGTTMATDDIGGTHYPRIKIGTGADGSYNDVSTSNPVPVSDAGGSLTIDGTVAVNGISGTVSLPTGAATAAKQPALGTAGSASADVITVQGIASMTALLVDGSAVTQPVSDGGGSLTVDGSVSIGAALPAGTNAIGKLAANDGVDIGDVTVTNLPATVDTNSGAAGASTLRAVLATRHEDATTPVAVRLTDGSAFGNTIPVSEQVATSGGGSSYSFLSTAAVQSAEIKGSAGHVYSMQFFNNSATIAYARLYNMTGAPGSGDTANIVWRGLIPANTSGAGFSVQFPKGKAFSSGIGIRVTGAIADNDATSLSANVILGNVDYK